MTDIEKQEIIAEVEASVMAKVSEYKKTQMRINRRKTRIHETELWNRVFSA